MIGQLPKFLEIGGKEYPIDSDFRTMLNIYAAFNDPELTAEEQCFICVNTLFEDFSAIPHEHIQEAVEKAYRFAGGGDIPEENVSSVKIIDWEQDERIIFPAVTKPQDMRHVPYRICIGGRFSDFSARSARVCCHRYCISVRKKPKAKNLKNGNRSSAVTTEAWWS